MEIAVEEPALYHRSKMPFCSRDPIGYADGASPYCTYISLHKVDPSGLHNYYIHPQKVNPPHFNDRNKYLGYSYRLSGFVYSLEFDGGSSIYYRVRDIYTAEIAGYGHFYVALTSWVSRLSKGNENFGYAKFSCQRNGAIVKTKDEFRGSEGDIMEISADLVDLTYHATMAYGVSNAVSGRVRVTHRVIIEVGWAWDWNLETPSSAKLNFSIGAAESATVGAHSVVREYAFGFHCICGKKYNGPMDEGPPTTLLPW